MSNVQFQDPYSFTEKLISRYDGGPPKAAVQALELIKRGKVKKAAELLKTLPMADLCLGCHVPNPKAGEDITNDEGEVVGVEPNITPDINWLPQFLGGPAVGDLEEGEVEEETTGDEVGGEGDEPEKKTKRKKKGG